MILQREESPGAENSVYSYREVKIEISMLPPQSGRFCSLYTKWKKLAVFGRKL